VSIEVLLHSPFNATNPDYVVLVCLRADRHGQAGTSYAAVQDMCRHLAANEVAVLRKPAFQFAASYSFTGKCGAERVWSVPSAVVKGPDACPEVSVDLLCGVRALTEEAAAILEKLRHICPQSDVSSVVYLKPGDILLMDNRKGAHARSSFRAYFDGQDRWLQRVYARRSLVGTAQRLKSGIESILKIGSVRNTPREDCVAQRKR
jgi:L-asparagine oxygenase